MALAPQVEVRRAADRFTTRTDWLLSRHSFSFGPHYDPGNVGHGVLVVHNDDVVQPDAGFGTHAHRDAEIVTWVLAGELAHEDSAGNSGVIHPGQVQRMTAGSGVEHSEHNAAGVPVRFVQMWVQPDTYGLRPSYEQRDVTDQLANGALVVVASGMVRDRGRPAVRLHQQDAALHAARLSPAGTVRLPSAAYLHAFVARGSVWMHGAGELAEGDAARCTATAGHDVVAGDGGAELLVWEMHARPS